MSKYEFYDLMTTDPLQWGLEVDPIGLLSYQTYKRKQQFYCEATDFWTILKSAFSSSEFATFKKIAEKPSKVSSSMKTFLSKALQKAIDMDRDNAINMDPNRADTPITTAVKLFTYSLKESSESSEQIDEVLTLQQRQRRKIIMRRLAPRLARARKIAMRRRGGNDVLKRRAKALARKTMAKKLLGGRNKADVSPSERARIEKILAKRKAGIERLATRLVPVVRKKQALRFAAKKPAVAKKTVSGAQEKKPVGVKKPTPTVLKKPAAPTAPTNK